jgi:hypothetical protein
VSSAGQKRGLSDDATDGEPRTTTPPNRPASLPAFKTTPVLNGYPVYLDLATVKALIDDFIEGLRPQIRDFLTKPRLPNWVPPESVDDETREFYSSLAIPLVNGKPSLLLHNLGRNPEPNVDNLFRKRPPNSVDNPPHW